MADTAPTTSTDAPSQSDAPPASPDAAPSGDHPNAPPGDQQGQPANSQGQEQQQQQQTAPAVQPQIKPVPFYPQDTGEMFRYAQWISRSELVPKALRGKPHDVLMVLLKGHDLGLRPQTSVASINVIEGKAEVGALLMVSLCLKSGLCEYFRLVSSDWQQATYETKRRGAEPIRFTYTIEEAEQMGLLDKGKTEWAKENNQWKKQPRTMLRRRCQSSLAREVYPDIVLGLYDHGELAEMRELQAREMAMGIDPDSVIPVVDVQTASDLDDAPHEAQPAAAVVVPSEMPALPEPQQRTILLDLAPQDRREPVPAKSGKRDPLKERMAKRAAPSSPPATRAAHACPLCGDPVAAENTPCKPCADGITE